MINSRRHDVFLTFLGNDISLTRRSSTTIKITRSSIRSISQEITRYLNIDTQVE